MRVVFFGNGAFGIPALRRLIHSPHKLMAVITNPDKPAGRGHQLRPTPIKEEALRLNLPIWEVESLKEPSLPERLRALEAHVFVVVAYRILPRSIWELPPFGALNIHPSLLPAYRGPAPIPWSIMAGEKVTGITIFRIREGVDTGEIVLQRSFPLPEEWDAGELTRFLSQIGADLLIEAIEGLATQKIEPTPQPNIPDAPYAPKLSTENTRISWNRPAEEVYNFIRALSPEPRAWTTFQGKRVHVLKVQRLPSRRVTHLPGTIWQEDKTTVVACQNAPLQILSLQLEGKKPISGEEFAQGYLRNQYMHFT
ncbi:MAG: methionyl-tRNA formyltransferase [Bacteroidia bacterium]|nr:methionyl-tRNA formyltransferase [Bacteroidia bacterium]MCX7651441.1 methionyl-tRNA formyltransferase [Bacteroidia bacterium]MDW8416804.1 methionyl-tRNA formyltransferase [Bacteroidia bacterium]